jgi:hypothetical protein
VEALLHDNPRNERLFHVGRLPQAAAAQESAPGAAGVEGRDQEGFDAWDFEPVIDKDETYLFSGDRDDSGPDLPGPLEEHMRPGGIGLS